ncbi:ComEC/Rec2 family competence protein [Tabrizicola oligotrophica]|uniref:ComEC family competence protein n=1 Tax=Tabrizicola oligotrophica TaxID=2710650 RepID=A0A6M0QWX9_9RHOB|nr:ComEC/Rec2 family competence protein [Tabrizicola oligotrophica]NEY91294.1 ComEC family competence protein [Tabrizicola oligotrophica]
MTRWLLWPLYRLLDMRGLLFPWVPVFLGAGIGLWFGLAQEPGMLSYGAAALGLGCCLGFWRHGPELAHPLAVIAACLLAGFLAAGARAHLVAAPMLEQPYAGPVQGRIVEIDRSQSDALRLTLDHVVLELPPDKTPARVRISLHGEVPVPDPDPGQVVLLTARLAAPEGPTEPGGFDFRRMAFFDGLGAVGYSRTPVVVWEDPAPGTQLVNRLRMRLSRGIMAALPGDAGAFASGAMTGDRSGISKETVEALRDSNLAHLLAISGMNMAFLTGFVFVLLRHGLALVPPLALRVNTKKLAAIVAFAVALFYLLLSGANVATERAFLMVSVMLGAILFDRRALTLRSVALSAVVLLVWQPESLTEPGFQLSFAATVALIAGFGALEGRVMRERLPRWVLPVFTLVLSSVIAGAATAPYAAATFNRFTDYGLVANLLTVPVMSLLMAAGAVAALLAPIGLAAPALWLMELAARWILFVAHWIAGLEGAVTPIVAPGPWVLPLLTVAGCWLVLMRGRVRGLSLLPLALGAALWAMTGRPILLISGDGALVGLMGPEGRALSAEKGAGFTAGAWLEKDGDLATQAAAFLRPGFSGPKTARGFVLPDERPDVTPSEPPGAPHPQLLPTRGRGAERCPAGAECGGPFRGIVLTGKTPDLAAACAAADLVILASDAAGRAPEGCRLIDRALLRKTGALALWRGREGWILLPAARAGRIWTGKAGLPDLPDLVW